MKESNLDICHKLGEPEDLMLSEIRQSQKDKYHMIPTYRRSLESSNSQRQKVEQWLSGAGGRGKCGVV